MDILDTAITRLLQTEYSMSMLLAKDTCINIINIAIYIEDTSDCTILCRNSYICQKDYFASDGFIRLLH